MIRGMRTLSDRGHGAHREVFAARSLRAHIQGGSVFGRCISEGFGFGVVVSGIEFVHDAAEVTEACSDYTDAFFQSIEGGTTDSGGEG